MFRRRIALFLPLLFLFFAVAGPALGQTLAIEDAQSQPVITLLEGSRAYLRVTDAAADLDPGSIETVTASVSSALGQDLEAVTLTETGPATGTFTGSIQLNSWGNVDGSLYTARTGFPTAWDTVTATYGTATASATTIGALLQVLDPQGNPLTFLPADGTVRLRVIDHNADGSPEVDTTLVQVSSVVNSSGDTEEITLTETGGSAGVFEGLHLLSSTAFSAWQDGVQAVRPGDMVYFSHTDGNFATVTEGQMRVFSDQPVTIQLENANGQPVTQILQFSNLYIRVNDPASAQQGWNSALAVSEIRGDQKTVYLDPDFSNPGLYRGHVFVQPKLLSQTPDALNLAVLEDPGPPVRFDTVRVTASCMVPPCPQASVQVVPSTLRFLDVQEQPVSRIPIGSTVILEGRDSSSGAMQVTLTAQPGGDTESLYLSYVRGYPDDIIFRATLTTAAGPAVPGDGVLQIQEGGTLTASHPNYLGLSTTTIGAPTGSTLLELLDHAGNPTTTVFEQSQVRVRARDAAGNLSPAALDTLSVVAVTKDVNGALRDQETFDLIETGPDTGVFTGQIPFWPTPRWSPENLTLEDWISANNEQDTVIVSRGATSVTGTVLPGRIWFVDADGNPATEFGLGSLLRIRAEGDAYNEPTSLNFIFATVRGLTSGSSVSVYLYETGLDTGLFAGTVDTGTTSGFSHLTVQPGEQVEAQIVYNALVPFSARATIGPGLPPVPQNDWIEVIEDGTASISVLDNDTSPDGSPLLVSAISVQPVHGTAAISGNVIVYTPAPNFFGDDQLHYTVQNSSGGTADAVVDIHIQGVDDAPVTLDDAITMAEDTAVYIGIFDNDTDPDGMGIVIKSVTQPAHGTLWWQPDGTVYYYPQANYNGPDSFTYTAGHSWSNAPASTATVRITVTPVSDPPVANQDTVTTNEDTPLTFSVLTNDVDVDGDTLTLVSTSQPAGGTVTFNANGNVTFTPQPNYYGTTTFNYSITDGRGEYAMSTVRVNINGVNDPPAATNDSATVAEDSTVTTSVLGNDSDPEGDLLSVSAVTPGAHGTTQIVNGTSVRYTPQLNYNGTDAFTYTVSDGRGGTAVGQVNVTINPQPDPPVAVADTATTAEDTPVTINVLANDSDPDGDTALTTVATTSPTKGTVVHNANHSFTYTPNLNVTGSDSFTYRVTDSTGRTATATVSLTITPVDDPPSAVNDAFTTAEDTAKTMDPRSNDQEFDGDPLSIIAVTQPAHGSAVFTATTATYTPAADYNGPDSFTYTLSDGRGGTSTATVMMTITAVNDPPRPAADSAATPEDTPLVIDVRANDVEVDAGDTLSILSVTQPAHGSTTVASGGVRYTPTANYNGPDSFNYTVHDGHGFGSTGTATVTITVTAVNDEPVAVTDQVTLNEDTPTTLNVLANDRDTDGDTLTIIAITQPNHGSSATFTASAIAYTPGADYNGPDSLQYTLSDGNGGTSLGYVWLTINPVNDAPAAVADTATTAEDTAVSVAVLANDSDAEGDTLTVTAVTQPAHGSATYTASGVTFTPAANYNGADSFTYTVSDGKGGAATGTVNVTVTTVNDAPSTGADTATTAEDTAKTISVLTNDSDPDGDTLSVTAVTQPAHGSVTFTASGVTYTPAANYNGPDSFTYTISDGNGGGATGTVSVTVTAVNDAPSAGADSATTAEDTATTISVLTNDSDPDGDSFSVTAVTQPAHGSVTFTASGVTYTPAANYNGPDSFTYTISDGNGGTATGTVSVTITAVNDTPSAGADSATTNEDAAATVSVLTNDSDPDGDSLSVTAVTQPAHGSVTFTASGVTYTPAANYNGADSFTYTISDGNSGSATGTVSISITAVNDPPAAINDTGATREGVAVTVSVLMNDSDIEGNPLTITAVSTPAKGTASFTSASVTYTPAANFNGTDTFTYTVSDGAATNTATVTITVKDALERVAVLATNSAWIQTGADVLSGDVVVNQAGPGPFLNGAELSLAGTVTTPAGWDLDADSLTIAAGTTVTGDVFFNQLTNSGTITGQQTATLTLPVFATLPAFLTATPNATDVNVAANGSRTLAPGTYRDLIVGKKGTVLFSGGTYHFRSITTDTQAKLLFSAASTVRVQQKMSVKATSTVGPNTGASINAASILFYVGGVNGTGGGLAETPKAVEIGVDNTLTANLYAPNGTLWIADRTQARGGFIGRDVQIGPDAQVTLQTAWSMP